MFIKKIIEDKKQWKAHKKRVNALPEDYKIVYKEIEKYLYTVGPIELDDSIELFENITLLFEEGVLNNKTVLEVTGEDVAYFCDELIKDSKTNLDESLEEVKTEVSNAMNKYYDKKLK